MVLDGHLSRPPTCTEVAVASMLPCPPLLHLSPFNKEFQQVSMQGNNNLTTVCGSGALLQAWHKALLRQFISSGINMFILGMVRTKQDPVPQLQNPTWRRAHGADGSIRKGPSTFQGNLELAAKLLESVSFWPEWGPTSSQTPG